MLSIIKKVKYNNYLSLSMQKKFISTSKNVSQINIIKQHKKILENNVNQQQNFSKLIRNFANYNHPSTTTNGSFLQKNETLEFMSVLPDVVRDLTEMTIKYDLKDSKDASNWFAKVLEYNLPIHLEIRGNFSVLVYKSLVDKSQLTSENIRLAHYLGWCIEMIQSMYFIIDDIMDNSSTRGGRTCWYKLENVGLTAINDSIMIENATYCLLKKYFYEKPYYTALLELFHETMYISSIGQLLDLQTANKNVTDFTMEKFKIIVANKGSQLFFTSFAAGIIMSGITDNEVLRQSKTILFEIAEFFQTQDDFLDCFGDPAVTGKLGTDIQENKCSWLAVVCMQRANEEQKNIMIECYGKNDSEKIARVKELYKELGLLDAYAQCEKDSYNLIKTHIEQATKDLPHEVYYNVLEKIYQRNY